MPRPKKQPDTAEEAQGTPATENQGKGPRVNKMQCMREALESMGKEAKPKELQDFLKTTFGLDMDPKMISTYKNSLLRKAGEKGKGRGRRAETPLAEAATPPARREVAVDGGGISLEDIRAVKELVQRLGAGKLRALMGVLYE